MNTTDTMTSEAEGLAVLSCLRKPPLVSWPAIFLMLAGHGGTILTWVLCLKGIWPLWFGGIVNGIMAYLLFTPSHDAMHRSVSSLPWLNELVLRISTALAVPFGKGHFFRVMHMQHHRFTNEENDPDHTLASQFKMIPLWGIWPFLYIITFAKNPENFPGLKPKEVWTELAIGFTIIGAFFLWIPLEMFWLWLVALYVGFFLMCLVFMVLPHYPHTVRESDDPYRASLIRKGHEWLLTPVLLYQNYHLVHHLYPTVPFYLYGKAWKAREAFHESNNPGIVPAFGLGAKD